MNRQAAAWSQDAVRRPLLAGLTCAALLWAVTSAGLHSWSADDAYISFRYARNLVEGQGLVFNAGEFVEGYTNFLWTLWIAVGLLMGFSAERWSAFWGVASLAASILLLIRLHLRYRRASDNGGLLIPFAALGAALHTDWCQFSISGLETAPFTALALAGFVALTADPPGPRRAAGAGLLLALASLTRPDGLLFALAGGLYVLWRGRPRTPAAACYLAALLVPCLLHLAWRVAYYGDWLPNTYYAKSADLAWYGQGLHYLKYYCIRYWPLAMGFAAASALRLRGLVLQHRNHGPQVGAAVHGTETGADPCVVLALAFAGIYSFYIVRVGGDFMFARLLIPTAPFCLILLEWTLWRLALRRRRAAHALAAVALLGLALTPGPVGDDPAAAHGIIDERLYYTNNEIKDVFESQISALRRAFADLPMPVRVALYGSQARLAYEARIPVAIEAHAGLTDRTIARQSLPGRGRVGHEKHATLEYLLERKVHFIFSRAGAELLQWDQRMPWLSQIELDNKVYGRVLYWDPPLMAELEKRGYRLHRVPELLDLYISALDQFPRESVAAHYQLLKGVYFDHVSDPVRETAIRQWLEAPP